MVDSQQPEQKSDAVKHPEEKQNPTERQAENKERSEAEGSIQNWTEHVKKVRAEKKASGRSGVTGVGSHGNGRGGFASAKSLLAGPAEETGTVIDYKPVEHNERSFSLGMDYEEKQRSVPEKLGDFAQAAARRATDPDGWNAWFNGEVQKIVGIGIGLNDAKEETKTAIAAGFKALTDGTVADFLSRPNAINEPLFKTVANVFDAVSSDPNATNKALEALGNAVMQSSNEYSAMSQQDQGKVIGKFTFGMVNPEGSTEGAELAIKIADKVATNVDKVVMDTVSMSVKAAQKAAEQSPELAQQTKQMLLDYLNSKGLVGPKLQYEGIPDGFFEGMQPTRNAAAENYMAMSGMDDAAQKAVRKPYSGIEEHPLSEKFFNNLKQITERLSESQQRFFLDNGIQIKPVRRVSDFFTNSERRAACYDPSEKIMYVAEEVYTQGRWQAAENLAFDFKHEMGHAVNSKCGKFGEPLSENANFRAVFRQDAEHLSMELLEDLKIPTHSPYAMRDEIFADLYGHLCGETTTNARSNQIRKLFPRCFEQLESMRAELP